MKKKFFIPVIMATFILLVFTLAGCGSKSAATVNGDRKSVV